MKNRVIAFLLSAMFCALTVGCGAVEDTEPTATEKPTPTPAIEVQSEPTPAPTPEPSPEPETFPCTVRADGTGAVLEKLQRGDKVEIVDDYSEKYYIVRHGENYGLMEKTLLRLSNQNPYEPWEGYACAEAGVYENHELTGEPVKRLPINTPLQVVEELPYCLLVQLDDGIVYIKSEDVSPTPISYSRGGNGGGSSGGADGGNIYLSAPSSFQPVISLLSYCVPQQGESKEEAIVKVDGAELLLGIFDMGDQLDVLELGEDEATIYYDGLQASVPRCLLRTPDEKSYTSWTAYATKDAKLYEHYRLGAVGTALELNQELLVLDEWADFYFVETEVGRGFVPKSALSETPVSYARSGGGGGNDAGWTKPAL